MLALNSNKQTCTGKEADASPQPKQTNLCQCGKEEIALTLVNKFVTKSVTEVICNDAYVMCNDAFVMYNDAYIMCPGVYVM